MRASAEGSLAPLLTHFDEFRETLAFAFAALATIVFAQTFVPNHLSHELKVFSLRCERTFEALRQ